ncbi:hypothetical protein GCM10010211_62090 [Streptomyces albospinus]|uniref:Transposase n=1 Tax=Streptomyces albospinus TaxID=285515 RepID=A0ABQ2VJN2_9ACTN|nr:hypothetical protein GCM10010211_62090 [Streptomyces albospinus]
MVLDRRRREARAEAPVEAPAEQSHRKHSTEREIPCKQHGSATTARYAYGAVHRLGPRRIGELPCHQGTDGPETGPEA